MGVPPRVLFRPAAAALLPTGKRQYAAAQIWVMTRAMLMMPHPTARTRFRDWPLAVKSILGFWFFYLLTVVARASLGSDPMTVLENKSVTITAGVILTAGIYAAIQLLAAEASLRRQAAVAGIASFVAAGALAGFLIAADKYQDKPHDEFHYVSKEGFQVTEVGDQTRIQRPNSSPVIVTWPRVSALDSYEQFRIATDSMVVWL